MKTNLHPPADLNKFFHWLKVESEELWKGTEIHKEILGFQLQRGTKWLPGLTDSQIVEYEKIMGFVFPGVFKTYLRCMNGTDKETLNVYGESGEPYEYGVGFYSYPRDVRLVQERIVWIQKAFKISQNELDIRKVPHIMPIIAHRFLIVDRWQTNPVLSMYGDDVVAYADSLNVFLYYSVFSDFGESGQQPNAQDIRVKFWLS